jgi:N-formylmaleamate deformylase
MAREMLATASRRISEGHLEELRSLGARSRWVESGRVRLHVLDYGGGNAPLLVLPGITSPAVTWDFVVAPLRDRFRPVVLDLRGRGLSDGGPGYALDDYAADAEAVIAALSLTRPLLLGHSLGARIAARVAARGSAGIAGTIAVDPPLSGPERGAYPTSREAFATQLAEGLAGTDADAVRRHYPRWPRSELALRARWLCTCDADAVMATYERFTTEDFFDSWPLVPAPAAVIRGEQSPVVTAEGAAALAAAHPAATVRTIPDAGHMVPWDNLDGFMAELRLLLASFR